MALFKVSTGTREPEVCGLKWDHAVKVPELETSVFIIPAESVKNREERLVVLNRVAKSVTELYNTGWKSARERAAEAWQSRHGEMAPEGFGMFACNISCTVWAAPSLRGHVN
jgi:site-specific recombinase XerD